MLSVGLRIIIQKHVTDVNRTENVAKLHFLTGNMLKNLQNHTTIATFNIIIQKKRLYRYQNNTPYLLRIINTTPSIHSPFIGKGGVAFSSNQVSNLDTSTL